MQVAKLALWGCLTAVSSIPPATAVATDEVPAPVIDFTSLSLEELLQVEITSLGKKSQRLADVAAAVHVINREDILRSGATSLPEVLRLAPGVDAARMGGDRWSVSIRGFSGRWANKLLVLVDGRSIYTPLYAGVEWEQENIPLELIERIEVIRGPAGSTWGANAVSGVINIITRSAKDTQGSEVHARAGTTEKIGATALHGVELGEDTHLRIFATGDRRGDDALASGNDANTASERARGGFRLDKAMGTTDFTVIGEAYYITQKNTNLAGDPLAPPTYSTPVDMDSMNHGAFLLGRWNSRDGAGRESALQAVLEHVYNDNTLGWSMSRDTLDVDWHTRHQGEGLHDLTWGVNYRVARDEMGAPALSIAYAPLERTLSTFSLYAQDEIAFADNRWLFSLGARLEHNSFTQWEFQPNARLLWHATPESSAWLSVARAVRTPSRTESDARFDFLRVAPPGDPFYGGALPVAEALVGNPDLESEDVTALELGYRSQWSPRLSMDAAAFMHRYKHLRSAIWDGALINVMGVYELANNLATNALAADVYGLEATADWRVSDDWRLTAAYSHAHLKLDDDSLDRMEDYEGSLPRHILSLRSGHELGQNMTLDFWLRHVSKRDTTQLTNRRVPAYTTLDARLAWKPRKDLELSLVGQNLLDNQHLEYVQEVFFTVPAEIRRSFHTQVSWKF